MGETCFGKGMKIYNTKSEGCEIDGLMTIVIKGL